MRTGLKAHQRHQVVSRAIGTAGSNVCDMEARQRMIDKHNEQVERQRKEMVTTTCDSCGTEVKRRPGYDPFAWIECAACRRDRGA
jgi:hypothetical protein